MLALVALAGSPAWAQDSVATSPGGNDALSAYSETLQRVRYVVDLVPIPTSWDHRVLIGPVVKASRDPDPMFNTLVLGSASISPAHLAPQGGVTFAPRSFALWNQPGRGVNPSANSVPPTISVSSFARQFAVGHTDVSSSRTNIVGAVIGQNPDAPERLYVERTVGAISRLVQNGGDTATLALGAVDAHGNAYFRADDWNSDPAFAVRIKGDNLVRVNLPQRSATGASALNILLNLFNPTNEAFDNGATAFIANNTTTTVNTPHGIPEALGGQVIAQLFGLDFEGKLVAGATAQFATRVLTHRAEGVVGLRGNASYSTSTVFGGNAGSLAALAVTSGERASAINVCGLSFGPVLPVSPAPNSPRLLSLPAPINGPGGFSANAANNAEFHHWLSQVSLRGPSGQVGLGQTDTGLLVAAATAKDPTAGEFIAVATVAPPPSTDPAVWTVAAHAGKPVLSGPDDGPGGADDPVILGTLIAGASASISSPGVDRLGNVYFVSRWQPDGGQPATGLFKAVRVGSAYQLELLLTTGQEVLGANSATPYRVAALTLIDADSIASGAFHQGQVLQSMVPGRETTDETSIFSMGGLIVNATLAYTRSGGQIEEYEAVLFVGPAENPAPPCPGDTNGDGEVNFADLNAVISAFNTFAGDPAYIAGADLDGDGDVDFA
ncbi:MAG: hypothetical protein IBJ10_11465, partial [Phycisphaerales bacterium]|nr:hypothetical protein [Phycisphaerales bacterium]